MAGAGPSIPPQAMAAKVATTIAKYKLNDRAINIEPEALGADWMNRMGCTPNITICHEVLAPSFAKDGFDPSLPREGICRSFEKDQGMREKLVAHNKSFSSGDSRYPLVFPHKMMYGTLGCTHVNFTARMFNQNLTTSQGLLCKVDDSGTSPLEELVRLGHKWIVLSHETPDDLAAEVSMWLNRGNNTSQVSHEIEHIRVLQRVCKKELEVNKSVYLSGIVQKAMAELKISTQATTMLQLARWVVDVGPYSTVDALCQFHSAEVNPNTLTINTLLFEEVAKTFPKECSNVKLDVMTLAYNEKGKIAKPRPQPDIADFIKVQMSGQHRNVCIVGSPTRRLADI